MIRRLPALFVAVMLVPAAALAWLGWRWLEQDRALEAQRARERQERTLQSAERMLDDREPSPPDGAVMVVIRPQSIELFPRTRLLYYPFLEALPEAPARLFEPGEEYEFRRQDHDRAIAAFRELARSRDQAVRAGAAVRLARNLRKMGRLEEALEVYQQLAAADAVAVGGVPAALVARRARGALLAEMTRPDELRREAEALAADLAGGRWQLERGVYLHHVEEAGRWLGGARGPDAQQETLAAAVARLWEKWSTGNEASGRESFQSQTLVWRSTPERMVALVAGPTFGEPEPAPSPGRRRLWLAGLAALVLLVVAGGYFIARAVSRELAVARLQSDFVAAVSHEFRTPLTSLRQTTEILADDRVVSDEQRRDYYQKQARATERLQRLVESLLDFGRMEAGRRPYRLERLDAGELVRAVVEEFQAEAGEYRVELSANGAAAVDADPDALGRALWNLLDNAVKYSPDCRTVWVELTARSNRLAITVRDQGIGIPRAEQKEIFHRFVRGAAAKSNGIKGTGVGLAMVRHIVEAHGGEVRLESEPGKGSTFTVLLPRA